MIMALGGPTRGFIFNPTQFFVLAFDDEDLPDFIPQRIKPLEECRCSDEGHDRDGHKRGPF
jgi:hypothetical protein